MEFEAWLLSMHNLFPRYNSTLSIDNIEQNIGCNLIDIDPEVEFYHPTNTLEKILQLIGESYTKSENQIESILSNFELNDISDAVQSNKCNSLKTFYCDICQLLE